MFKSLTAIRISAWTAPALATLEAAVERGKFVPCGPTTKKSFGWEAPRAEGGALIEPVNDQWVLKLTIETKSVPASTLKREVENRCKSIERREGRKPGKRERRELKETVESELLPKAFPRRKSVNLWVDRAQRFIFIGTNSKSVCDDVVEALLDALTTAGAKVTLDLIHTKESLSTVGAQWLRDGEADGDFHLARSLEVITPDEDKAVVRYARHNLDFKTVKQHIQDGMAIRKLGLTWNDAVEFEVDETLTLSKINFHEDPEAVRPEEGEDTFDATFTLTSMTLGDVIPDLISILGGEVAPPTPAAPAAAK